MKLEKNLGLSFKIVNGKSNLANIERVLTIENTLDQPTINSVFKGDNGSLGFSVIKVLTERFISSFGFSTKMTENQLEMLTVDTFDKFGYDSLFDIILFFKMARSGSFGETNRGVDSNLIYGKWFPMYLEKKAESREMTHNKQKEESKIKNNISFEDVEITYRKRMKLKEDLIKSKNRDIYILDLIKNMDRQMLEDTIYHWNRDEELKNHVTMLKLQRRVIKE